MRYLLFLLLHFLLLLALTLTTTNAAAVRPQAPIAEDVQSFVNLLKASKKESLAGFATGVLFGKKLESMFSSVVRLALLFPLVTSVDSVRDFIKRKRGPVQIQLEKGLDEFVSDLCSSNSSCDSKRIRRVVQRLNQLPRHCKKAWQTKIKPLIKRNNALVSGFLLGLSLRMVAFAALK
ncbi:hypothetical protein TrLO_g5658 [Triparma laevis f. longispina]|uniref:Uncharacterized protein n=1 Tax=Triparma laevis f. longispina TaxID=1714387 RepID=A0A9W7F806_9STRA|nr:hypothetical protein TrLO_g5658 [Triparma laevis f. longispina]